MALSPELAADSSRIVQALAWAAKSGDVTPSQEAEVLTCLEDFECWIPLIKFLNDRIRKDKSDQFLRIRLARIQHRYLHDASGAAETIGDLISEFGLEFDRVDAILSEYVCESEDWTGYAQILELCWTSFSQAKSQVKAIERLCAVFEKKKHDDDRVYEYYSKLLKLDQSNLKALRYFKIIATQSNDWQAVATYLSRLLQTAHHSNDRFRHAQELAAVQIYQLDKPADALATLRQSCVGSPLDYSNIEFDIYMRTNDQRGCSTVLKRVLENTKDTHSAAVLNLKIGMIEESLGQPLEAERSYLKAIEQDSRLLEPLERLAVMNAKLRNWKNTAATLRQIGSNLQNESLRAKITQLLERIELTAEVPK